MSCPNSSSRRVTWWSSAIPIGLKHKGEFQGIPPTGKELSVTGTDIYRIVDGKIVEPWVEADMLGLMQQLGVLSTPGQA
jgi:hypothetical protein